MTTTYSITRDAIISAALRKLQVIELGVTPDADTLANAAQSLNILVKAWQSNGIKLWTVEEYTLTMVAGTTSYVIGPSGPGLTGDRPLKVVQAWLRNTSSSIDTQLNLLSKQEYNLLSAKSNQGTPNSIFYDPDATTSGTMYLWLTPDSATATAQTVHFVGQRPINDISLGTDVPDFPNEWMQALVWGLADELALEYGLHVNTRVEIATKADKYRRELEDWDVETSSTFFSPNFQG